MDPVTMTTLAVLLVGLAVLCLVVGSCAVLWYQLRHIFKRRK